MRSNNHLSGLHRAIRIDFFLTLTVYSALLVARPAQAQTFSVLHAFQGTDGFSPLTGLVQGTDGNFYGTTFYGGTNNGDGTVFKITAAGKITTLHSFKFPEGADPTAKLVQGTDGNLYGTTYYGGRSTSCGFGCGIFFKITPEGKMTQLHSFCPQSGCADGANPYAGLIQGSDGDFYGTTVYGGASSDGTVFKVTARGKVTTLHTFCLQNGCPDGYWPYAGLVQGADGTFYGTTTAGGAGKCPSGCGTIFKITAAGKFTTLYNFCTQTNCPDGLNPEAELVQGTDGRFYGTTAGDYCLSNCGTVFKVTAHGKLTTLHRFCALRSCADGAMPHGLVQASDGNLYGTAQFWGAFCKDCGTVFKITPAGKLTTLHSFCRHSSCPDGASPLAGLLQGTHGTFYGATSGGGVKKKCAAHDFGCGTVFRLCVGLKPFVSLLSTSGKVGTKVAILGQGFQGTTSVSFNGTAAKFVIHSNTYLTATVPSRATCGFVIVTTTERKLKSSKRFRVVH